MLLDLKVLYIFKILISVDKMFADFTNDPYANVDESDDEAATAPYYVLANATPIAGWDT